MAIFDLHSKRRRDAQRSGKEEIYQYDSVPDSLRSQIKRITREGFGENSIYSGGQFKDNPLYVTVHDIYCREVGLDFLGRGKNKCDDLIYTLATCETEVFLDLIELICGGIDRVVRQQDQYDRSSWKIKINPDEAIDEINYRFREAALGFQFESGELVRQDSKFLHDEITKPALTLLNKTGYAGAQEEFLSAYRYYKSGDYEQAIVEAAKSFESMMKAVCDQKSWEYSKGARASDLLKVLRTHSFLPDYLNASFDQLAATLNSGLPKVRDDSGAHGQGAELRSTPHFIAAYALHLAAAKIVLLGEAAQIETS